MSDPQVLLEQLAKAPLLRHNQRAALEDQRGELDGMLNDSAVKGQDRGMMLRERQSIEQQLHGQSPRPTLTPAERDLLATTERRLRDELLQGAPTKEELRRNPAGTVGRLQRYEKANKQKMLWWKNIRIQLEPDNTDQDLANFEQYRPETAQPNGAATFMANAQIPGHFAMTPAAKANWPEEMPPQGTANSPLKHAQRRQKSPEERQAIGRRLQAARQAKRQAQAGGAA